jgi:hypothetical protein
VGEHPPCPVGEDEKGQFYDKRYAVTRVGICAPSPTGAGANNLDLSRLMRPLRRANPLSGPTRQAQQAQRTAGFRARLVLKRPDVVAPANNGGVGGIGIWGANNPYPPGRGWGGGVMGVGKWVHSRLAKLVVEQRDARARAAKLMGWVGAFAEPVHERLI